MSKFLIFSLFSDFGKQLRQSSPRAVWNFTMGLPSYWYYIEMAVKTLHNKSLGYQLPVIRTWFKYFHNLLVLSIHHFLSFRKFNFNLWAICHWQLWSFWDYTLYKHWVELYQLRAMRGSSVQCTSEVHFRKCLRGISQYVMIKAYTSLEVPVFQLHSYSMLALILSCHMKLWDFLDATLAYLSKCKLTSYTTYNTSRKEPLQPI